MSLKHLFTDLFTGRAGSSLPQGLCSSRGEWGLLSSCGVWDSRCGGFSCCRAGAPGCEGFSGCGALA